MDATIIVAIIGGLATAIPTMIANLLSNKNNKDLILYRVNELEKKVEKHNNVVERTAIIEKDIKAIWRNVDKINEEVNKK